MPQKSMDPDELTLKIRNIALITSPRFINVEEYYRYVMHTYGLGIDEDSFKKILFGIGFEIIDGYWA